LDPAALDVSFSPLQNGEYRGPKSDGGRLQFALRVRNRSAESRAVEVRVWKVAQWGTALGLSRPAGTEAWRPAMGHFERVSYLGRTSEAAPDAPISGWIQTRAPADLYVEFEKPVDPAAVPRGDLVAELRGAAGVVPVGFVAGASYGANWSWQRVGSVPACPEGAELVIRAKNPAGDAIAHLHVDHYALVSPGTWAPAGEGHLDLQRFEERTLQIDADAAEDAAAPKGNVYFFEIFDPKFKTYRSLLWHVGAP
jgi:hypothetical protein